MKILVVGSGSCEHAVIEAFRKSELCDEIYCAPGNAGIASVATCVDISPKDTQALCDFALREGIAFTFTCSHVPIQNDIAARFEGSGLKILAPGAETVRSLLHAEKTSAICEDAGISYDLSTEGEVSRILCLADGRDMLIFPQTVSYDTLFDNNEGPSSGSMGAVCSPSVNFYPESRLRSLITEPLMRALRRSDIFLSGMMGLKISGSADSPVFRGFDMHVSGAVFSAILKRLDSDLLSLMLSASDGLAGSSRPVFNSLCSVSAMIICSRRITEPQKLVLPTEGGVSIYHSHTVETEEGLMASGRKVVVICSAAKKLETARSAVYNAISTMSFPGMYFRSDIARGMAGGTKR
ncbi:MAG: hypothetical protein J5822_07890 [Eubacteriaceae bacterium]|nr:hypothetical protein [Eubacteriaceae bacterium]